VNRYPRLRVLLLVASALAMGQMIRHTWDWFVHREARVELVALRERVVDAGASMVHEQLEAERIRATLEEDDRILEKDRLLLDSYGRFARGQVLPNHLYGSYRQELDEFNRRVLDRNARLEQLRATLARRASAAGLYNTLTDSMRVLAVQAGDPFHPIPLPAEAATERGIAPDRSE
jgi:hypothetical protein